MKNSSCNFIHTRSQSYSRDNLKKLSWDDKIYFCFGFRGYLTKENCEAVLDFNFDYFFS
jgi:hypothetical protein